MAQVYKVGKVATVIGEEDEYKFVQYHQTKVVRWNNQEIILNTGGYKTTTTKTRMNQTSIEFNLGFDVYQKNFQWFVYYKGVTVPFGNYDTVVLYRNLDQEKSHLSRLSQK